MNRRKEIFLPARSLIPATTTLAEAPIRVKLPPKSAPRASAHHKGRTSASESPSAWARSCITGIMVAVKGMLSTIPLAMALPHITSIAVRVGEPPTPIRISASTKSPTKKSSVGHSTSRKTSSTSVLA